MCLPCKYKFRWPSFLRKPKPALTDCFIEDANDPVLTTNYIICDI